MLNCVKYFAIFNSTVFLRSSGLENGRVGPYHPGIRITEGTTPWYRQQTTRQAMVTHSGTFVKPLYQWKSNKYYILWVCVCSLRLPAHNAHAPYCHLWPVLFFNIFPHHLINGMIFEEKLLKLKRVFWFSLQLLADIFLILRRTERDMVINYRLVFM